MDFVLDNDNDHGRAYSGDDKWGKDGPNKGCLMAVAKFGSAAVLTVAAVYIALHLAVPAVEALWH